MSLHSSLLITVRQKQKKGSKVRVGYSNGILTTEPELTEDIYIEKLNTEGEIELVRTTYN